MWAIPLKELGHFRREWYGAFAAAAARLQAEVEAGEDDVWSHQLGGEASWQSLANEQVRARLVVEDHLLQCIHIGTYIHA